MIRQIFIAPLKEGVSEEKIQQTFHLQPVPWAENGYYYTTEDQPGKHPWHEAGLYYIQEPSAQAVVTLLSPQPGERILDLCAAPGGKTMLAAEKARQVLSRDVSEAKCAYIEENVARMRLENVEIQVYDGTTRDETLLEKADVVLADVPCSGLGVIGKKRDIKYHASPEKIADIVELQRQIISASWEYVKKGGVLLYSTCTINAEENEKQVRWILEKFPFELETEQQIFPSEGRGDGFYFARLRRKMDD